MKNLAQNYKLVLAARQICMKKSVGYLSMGLHTYTWPQNIIVVEWGRVNILEDVFSKGVKYREA